MLDLSGNIEYICDSEGNAIGFRKTVAQLNVFIYYLAYALTHIYRLE
tara:strand:- start:206 stop:346 length:141 start_codon:yes stop_codon:yes gene_type:complete